MKTLAILAALLFGCVDDPLECEVTDDETGECLELDSTEQATLNGVTIGITCTCSSGYRYCKNCPSCSWYYTGSWCTP